VLCADNENHKPCVLLVPFSLHSPRSQHPRKHTYAAACRARRKSSSRSAPSAGAPGCGRQGAGVAADSAALPNRPPWHSGMACTSSGPLCRRGGRRHSCCSSSSRVQHSQGRGRHRTRRPRPRSRAAAAASSCAKHGHSICCRHHQHLPAPPAGPGLRRLLLPEPAGQQEPTRAAEARRRLQRRDRPTIHSSRQQTGCRSSSTKARRRPDSPGPAGTAAAARA